MYSRRHPCGGMAGCAGCERLGQILRINALGGGVKGVGCSICGYRAG